ncbi:MAG: lytic murein transglycosylase [Candidatus Pacebacteria bacterium]|nr:lytic murein transglycosylase [Candidatus Paceibacterota bacterium]
MKRFCFSKILLSFFVCLALFAPNLGFLVLADSDPASERTALELELKELENQIANYEKDISKTQAQKNTLKNQISLLKKKIDKLNLQIQQGNIMIKDLNIQISDTETSIIKTSKKIDDSKEKLTSILRIIYEEDQKSGLEVLLSGKEISDFFDNLMALEVLNSKNQDLLKEIKNLKSDLESQKTSLDSEKSDLENVVKIQTLQKKENESNKITQESLLKLTEAEYQKSLQQKAEAEKKAAEIRSRIFQLIGVSKAPTFGEAYEIAKYVSGITGIRPAFLLAILTQESNIGQNVGQCYLKDPKTGSGIYIKTGATAPNTMSPKEVPYFLEIINNLNKSKGLSRDAYQTPVSCCMYSNGKPYGWGGAMGPSQFIPSTWSKYGQKVTEITGKASDPWNISDAFLATGLYLRDLGGAQKEFNAAMHYFSGATWAKWEEFYGRSAVQIANQYEADIKDLEGAK